VDGSSRLANDAPTIAEGRGAAAAMAPGSLSRRRRLDLCHIIDRASRP
jgi:hypothetical protein